MKTRMWRGSAPAKDAPAASPWAPRPFAAPRPRPVPAVPRLPSPGVARGAVQRLSVEQQEVFDTLPGLITDEPEQALSTLAGLGAEDFRAIVAELPRESVEELMANVRGDSMGLVEFAQPYAGLIGDIRNERIASSAEALEGKLDWIGSGLSERLTPSLSGRNLTGIDKSFRPNQFTMWVVGTRQDEPTDESSMNCWESCLYAGFKAGIFSKGLIDQIYKLAIAHTHQTAQKEISKLAETVAKPTLEMVARPVQAAYKEAMGAFLGAQEGEVWEKDDAPPPRGYLLFFNGVDHVVLSLGSVADDDSPGGDEPLESAGTGARLQTHHLEEDPGRGVQQVHDYDVSSTVVRRGFSARAGRRCSAGHRSGCALL